MDIYDLIIRRRTIRRFQKKPISRQILEKLINAARLAPSAANLQPCEYVVIDDEKFLEKTFETLCWAGYIAPGGNPPPGERPVAYIVVLVDENKSKSGSQDAAAAIENMILVALSEGLGSCWIGSVEREKLTQLLDVPSHHRIDSALALGYPLEEPILEVMTDSIKYWKDEKNILHVPKRRLKDIIHWQRY